jgi:2,3-bisphosphoglycerate-independent phosphoglycerate mutase
MQPEMSAKEVTDRLLEKIDTGKYDVIILNYANCDMVGHTGVFEAAVTAVETVDECVGRVYEKVLAENGVLLITADHGNADKMAEEDGAVFTAHTTNPVPFILVSDKNKDVKLKTDGSLANVAPTIIELMNLEKPAEMVDSMIIK